MMTFLPRLLLLGLTLAAAPFLLRANEPARLGFGAGLLGVLDHDRTLDFSADYRFATRGLVQPRLMATWATDGARFIGAGALLNLNLDQAGHARLTLGFGPGYYERNRGRDLGSSVEFTTTVEISFDAGRRRRLGLALGHISNGGLRGLNPGTETLMLTWSIPVGH